jgi:3-oxoacyl-[acyl-carrier protein] reductase
MAEDPTSLASRHALVCGASRGIGRAAALALAERGAAVTALARSEERLRALVTELEAAGASAARYLVADLDDRDAACAKVQDLITAEGPIHVLVNNAGGPPGGPLLEATEEQFLTALSRHLLASHRLTQLVVPGMKAAGYGRILNVVSTSVREPILNLGVSNTTRGAMASWAKTLSKELPPGITINNVLPGFVDTERLASLGGSIAERTGQTLDDVRANWLRQVPEGRLGRPEELGRVIAFLASPAGSFIRGQSLAVDGGRLNGI